MNKTINKEVEEQPTLVDLTDYVESKIGLIEAINKNYNCSKSFLTSSAEKNNVDAQNSLGVVFEREKQYEKAAFWYKVASSKSSIACVNLGKLYRKGWGVKQDYEEAVEWFKKGTKFKNSVAYSSLGYMYENGYGVEKDLNKAFALYKKGYKVSNYLNDECALAIGCSYEYGNGIEVNYEKALEYYEKAAKLDNEVAKYNAGLAYLYGRGTEVDVRKGIEYLIDSADDGYPDAMAKLASLFYKSNIVKSNGDICFYWTDKAADEDNLECLQRLAMFTLTGTNCTKDLDYAHCIIKHILEVFPKNKETLEAVNELRQYCKKKEFWESFSINEQEYGIETEKEGKTNETN